MAKVTKGKFRQVGALCYRHRADGILEIAMVTTRDSGRWILPKGWPIKGLKNYEAAETEALEEAGLVGQVAHRAIGSFVYDKQFPKKTATVTVDVYPLKVDRQLDDWREKGQRDIMFYKAEEAAGLISDAGAAKIIRAFAATLAEDAAAPAPTPGDA